MAPEPTVVRKAVTPVYPPVCPPVCSPVFPSEADAAAPAAPALPATSLAAVIAGHVLRDGELVLLMLRPSRWFILLSSLRFLAVAIILMAGCVIFDDRIRIHSRQCIDVGVFAIAVRLMWATLQWAGRVYILTDLRIIRMSGVFSIHIFDCPLRRVARTLLEVTFKERLCRVGSIVIIPQDEDSPLGTWRMIAQPRQIHEQVLAAISRAKQGGHAG